MKEKEKNAIVRLVNWLVDTLAESLVSLFDGIRNAVDHANPSLFGLVATFLPFVLPLPVAFMTAHSARQFFRWDDWQAITLGLGLEGLGLIVWVGLADAYVTRITSTQEKFEDFIGFLVLVAASYEIVLILVNVILALNDGAGFWYAVALLLICLLPAMSSVMYGINKRAAIRRLERERVEEKAEAERIRQERRQDRKEREALKLQHQYASESEERPSKHKLTSRK